MMIKSKFIFFTFIGCILGQTLPSQAQLPKGKFLKDSMYIGEPIRFVFSYLHPSDEEIFFPDTTFDFSPFEVKNKTIFPTITNEKGSLDSVTYELVSYSTQPIQTLRLPIVRLEANDSTQLYSFSDTIYLKHLVNDLATTAQVQSDKRLISIEEAVDYWKYFRKAFSIFLVAILVYFLFAKSIQRKYYELKFRKKHRDFSSDFRRWMRDADKPKVLNESLIAWKQHLQWLEKKPFSSFTTKEIIENIPNERLGEALREIDMAIYGGLVSPQMSFALNKLLEVANEVFKERFLEYKGQLRQKS